MIGGLARVDVLESPGATLYLSVFASDEIGCHLGKTETAEERWAGRGEAAGSSSREPGGALSRWVLAAGAGMLSWRGVVQRAAPRSARKHAATPRPPCFPSPLLPRRYQAHAGGKLAPPVGGEARLGAWPGLVPTEVQVRGDSWRESSTDVAIAGLGWVGVGVSGTAALRVWAPPGVAITTHDALVPDFARDLERPGFGLALTDAGKNRWGLGGRHERLEGGAGNLLMLLPAGCSLLNHAAFPVHHPTNVQAAGGGEKVQGGQAGGGQGGAAGGAGGQEGRQGGGSSAGVDGPPSRVAFSSAN